MFARVRLRDGALRKVPGPNRVIGFRVLGSMNQEYQDCTLKVLPLGLKGLQGTR